MAHGALSDLAAEVYARASPPAQFAELVVGPIRTFPGDRLVVGRQGVGIAVHFGARGG